MLNKLIVEQNVLHLHDDNVELNILSDKLDLTVQGTVYCKMIAFSNKEFNIHLEENSHLTIDFFLHLNDTQNKITIENKENAKLDLHYACTYSGENELIIDSNMKTSNNDNKILIRAVEEEGTLLVKAIGNIESKTKDNTYLEDIKAITNHNHRIKIMPDLLVKTDSVSAVHNATISPIDTDELFYLESKGLDKNVATSLIKEGFLKGIVEKEKF